MHAAEKQVEWCLRKARQELAEGRKHRGLVKTFPSPELAAAHIRKAEHNLAAITTFSRIGYSDWSAAAAFYAAYHCFLAILAKAGYESRNQECTFALIFHLIETGLLKLSKELIEDIHAMEPEESHASPTITGMREAQQYGVSLSISKGELSRLLSISRAVMDEAKVAIEGS